MTKKYFAESELIINKDGSIFHIFHPSRPAFWVYVNIFFIKVIICFWYRGISKAIYQQRFLADASLLFRAVYQQKDSRSA